MKEIHQESVTQKRSTVRNLKLIAFTLVLLLSPVSVKETKSSTGSESHEEEIPGEVKWYKGEFVWSGIDDGKTKALKRTGLYTLESYFGQNKTGLFYTFEVLQQGHYFSKGHRITLKLNLTKKNQTQPLHNNTIYEFNYSTIKGMRVIRGSQKRFKAQILFEQAIDSSSDHYPDLTLRNISNVGGRPILQIKSMKKVSTERNDRIVSFVVLCALFCGITSPIWFFLDSNHMLKFFQNIHLNISFFFFWLFKFTNWFLKDSPFSIYLLLVSSTLTLRFGLILLMIIFTTIEHQCHLIKAGLKSIYEAYTLRENLIVVVFAFFVLTAKFTPKSIYVYSIFFQPLMWRVDAQVREDTQSFIIMALKSLPGLFMIISQFYLPSYWIQTTSWIKSDRFSSLVEVDSMGLQVYLGGGF